MNCGEAGRERGRKKMRFVVEGAIILPSPSITVTIFVTRIGEPEMDQFIFLSTQMKATRNELV